MIVAVTMHNLPYKVFMAVTKLKGHQYGMTSETAFGLPRAIDGVKF
jgi:hypothetical protein